MISLLYIYILIRCPHCAAGLLEQPKLMEEGTKRIRKKTERLETSFEAQHTPRESVEPGTGDKLSEFDYIDACLHKIHPYELKPLHRVIYLRSGGIHEVRRNIRNFNGFNFKVDSESYNKRVQSLNRLSSCRECMRYVYIVVVSSNSASVRM